MTPSSTYFPSSLADRREWLTNFNTGMQKIGASLGFSAPELLSLSQDWETFDYLATAQVTMDSYAKAVRTYRRTLTQGSIGEVAPAFPADISFSMPFDRPAGLFERVDQFVRRVRVAPAYTPEIGALLRIAGATSRSAVRAAAANPLAEVAPKITASVAPGNVVLVKFRRTIYDGALIEAQIDNDVTWNSMGRFVRSPATLHIAASENNLPRQVEIRARFITGNDPVGDWSDTVTVQTIP